MSAAFIDTLFLELQLMKSRLGWEIGWRWKACCAAQKSLLKIHTESKSASEFYKCITTDAATRCPCWQYAWSGVGVFIFFKSWMRALWKNPRRWWWWWWWSAVCNCNYICSWIERNVRTPKGWHILQYQCVIGCRWKWFELDEVASTGSAQFGRYE